jgi:hypothetical protein
MATHTYLEFAEVAVVIAESRKPRCCGWGLRRLRAAGNLQYVAHFGPPGDCRMPDEFLPRAIKDFTAYCHLVFILQAWNRPWC